jgi:hypothetical protein
MRRAQKHGMMATVTMTGEDNDGQEVLQQLWSTIA